MVKSEQNALIESLERLHSRTLNLHKLNQFLNSLPLPVEVKGSVEFCLIFSGTINERSFHEKISLPGDQIGDRVAEAIRMERMLICNEWANVERFYVSVKESVLEIQHAIDMEEHINETSSTND